MIRQDTFEDLEIKSLAVVHGEVPEADHPLQAAREVRIYGPSSSSEFYTALLLEACGIPRDMFTAVFALGRVLGWTAHVFEQVASGRLIRPESEYVGPAPAWR